MSRRRQRRLMRQLGLRRGRGIRIVIGLIVLVVVIAWATWVWETWNRAMHPGVTDAHTAIVFLAGAVVTLVIGEVLAAGRRAVRKEDDRPGPVTTAAGMLVLPLPALALWAAVGWLPWTAHYGILALVTLVLIPVVGWSVASQIASHSRTTAPITEVLEPIRRHSIVPILGALTGTGAWTTLTLIWGTPGVIALVGWTFLTAAVAAGILAGVVIAREHRGDENLAGQVAAVLGVPDQKLAEMRWWIDRRQRIHIKGPLPASAINYLPDLSERIVSRLPSHEVGEASASMIVLVPVTKATQTARELLNDTDEFVFAETEIPDPPGHRPDARLWELTDRARPTTGPHVDAQAAKRGLSLIEYLPASHTAVVARLDDRTRALRERVAHALKVQPWDIELTAEWEVDDDDRPFLTVMRVVRAPAGIDPAKRRETWLGVAALVAREIDGWLWRVDEDVEAGTTTVARQRDPLLAMSTIEDFIANQRSSSLPPDQSWQAFPVAIEETGKPVMYTLFHTLIVGQTGAGKGSVLWSILSGLLPAARESLVQIYGIDPKSAEFFVDTDHGKRPHGMFSRVATDADAWSELLSEVHAEMKRRQAVSGRSFKISTSNPLIVLMIDELSALTALDTDGARSKEVQAKLLEILSQGRSDGVIVVTAVQAPQKEMVGKMRQFLAMRVALRTETAVETDLVLGQGASEAGAAAHLIPPAGPGNGYATAGMAYMDVEGAAGALRVRFPYTDDATLAEWSAEFADLFPGRQDQALVVAEPGDEPVGGRARAREQRSGKAGGGGDAVAALRELQRLDAEREAAAVGGGEDWASVEPPDSIEPDEPWLTGVPAWQYDND